MIYEMKVCKNCGRNEGVTNDNKCKFCGADAQMVPYSYWFHQDYNVIENPETIERMDKTDNLNVKARPISGAELIAGLRDTLICVAIAVCLLIFGFLLSKTIFIVPHIMGILMMIGAPLMLIFGICIFCSRIFGSTRAKTPEKAFKMFWESVFQTKTFSDKYESAEIAQSRICRSLPDAIRLNADAAQIQVWVEKLRTMIAKSNDELAEDSSKYFKGQFYDAKGDGDKLTIKDIAVENVDEHKAVVTANIEVARSWTRSVQRGNSSDTYCYEVSSGILHAKTTLLKADKYWYIPDFMPEIENGEQTNYLKGLRPKNNQQGLSDTENQ